MPRFAANLTLMYTDLPLMERFEASARDGFEAVEILFPYDVPPAELAAALRHAGQTLVLFNAPPGDFAQGDRGLAACAGREDEFRRSVQQALKVAEATGCRQIHTLIGVGDPVQDGQWMDRAAANLAHAARAYETAGVTLLLEAINPRDMPGYLMNRQAQSHELMCRIDRPNVRMQFDFYHCQISEGDVSKRFLHYLPHTAHVQIAGVPTRNEPDVGEVHYPHLFALMDEAGYAGWVGCEYRPADTGKDGTRKGLGWLRRERERRAATRDTA